MTFTVEIEKDYMKVVTLDDKSQHEDLEIYLEDNGTVFIRQYAETLNEYQVIHISYKQFIDMVKSLEADAVNGMYRMETVNSGGSVSEVKRRGLGNHMVAVLSRPLAPIKVRCVPTLLEAKMS